MPCAGGFVCLSPPAVGPPASATVEPKKEEAPGSAASATDSKDEVESKENLDTPKAVVKPNVLSHVIDGHVIKESSTPFPVRDDKEGNDQSRTSVLQFNFSSVAECAMLRFGTACYLAPLWPSCCSAARLCSPLSSSVLPPSPSALFRSPVRSVGRSLSSLDMVIASSFPVEWRRTTVR